MQSVLTAPFTPCDDLPMFLFESQLHALLAVGAGVAIGLPIRALTINLATRALNRLFPAKPNPAERVDRPAPTGYPSLTPPPAPTA